MKADFENDSLLVPLALVLPSTLCIYLSATTDAPSQRSDPADRRDVTSPGNSGPLENLKTTNRPLAGTFNVTSVEFETSIT